MTEAASCKARCADGRRLCVASGRRIWTSWLARHMLQLLHSTATHDGSNDIVCVVLHDRTCGKAAERAARNIAYLWKQGAGAALRPVPMKHVWGRWLERVGHVTKWRPGQLARWEGRILRAPGRCQTMSASAHRGGTEARPAVW